jgi:hypothetical protein
MINALKLIIAKSPEAMKEALNTIRALDAKSPILQQRYNRVVEIALNDPRANFSSAERALLAKSLDAVSATGRNFMLRIRLTDAERADLQYRSDVAGMSMSEFVRDKIFES